MYFNLYTHTQFKIHSWDMSDCSRSIRIDVFHCSHIHTPFSLNNYTSSLIPFPYHRFSFPKEVIINPCRSRWYPPADPLDRGQAVKAFVLCACKVLAWRGSAELAKDIYPSLLNNMYRTLMLQQEPL